jgi:hypothetical protein
MQSVFAPARRGAVQALRLTLMAAALGFGNLPFNGSIEMSGLELIAVAGGSRRLETEIQSYRIAGHSALLDRSFHGKAQPPVSNGILSETAGFPCHSMEQFWLKHAKGSAGEAQRLRFTF